MTHQEAASLPEAASAASFGYQTSPEALPKRHISTSETLESPGTSSPGTSPAFDPETK